MKKNKVLKYWHAHEFIGDDFVLAQKAIPEWYKKMAPTHNAVKGVLPVRKTMKACIPVFDAMTSGYIITTNVDIGVSQTNNGPVFTWNNDSMGILKVAERDVPYQIPLPNYYATNHLIWKIPYVFQTPKGYSLLATHPFNRPDLPFQTFTGIVDSEHGQPNGNYPFILEKGFEGVIPANTPIVQLLPIKRHNWKKRFDNKLERTDRKLNHLFSKSNAYYKKNYWVRKFYE